MPKDNKLQALRKAKEIEEQKALEEKQKVEIVVEERQKIVDSLQRKHDALCQKLERMRTTERGNALHVGDATQLGAIFSYEKRVNAELEELSCQLDARRKELKMALERGELADQDLLRARVERKKIEKFLDNRQLTERVVDAAIEEALTDEMNYYRRDK